MATKYEEVPPSPVVVKPNLREAETICDMCGRVGPHKHGPKDVGGWFPSWACLNGTEEYPRKEVNQITSGWGYNYVEVAMKIDLCPECFHNKLIPWLQAQGVDTNARTRQQGGCNMEPPW